MSRLLALAVLALLAVGCGSEGRPIPPAHAAPPQNAELSWLESFGQGDARIVFGVDRFEVLEDGWRAEISLSNRTPVRYSIGDPRSSLSRRWGLMLFQSGDLRHLEQLNRAGELPPVRPADTFEPSLPLVLEPDATWKGVVEARGALPAGSWLRIVFGALVPIGQAPRGFPEELVWITDHAYQLEG